MFDGWSGSLNEWGKHHRSEEEKKRKRIEVLEVCIKDAKKQIENYPKDLQKQKEYLKELEEELKSLKEK
jgi:chromosome segregation ATPase